MLIGVDASRATGGQRTGTENYSLHLIRALLRGDLSNSYVLYCNQPPALGTFSETPNGAVRSLPSRHLWTHLRLASEIARRPPDVLFVPAHVVPVVCRCPAVVTIHDLGYLAYPEAHSLAARLYLNLSTRHSVRVARRVIAVSQATKGDLTAKLGVPAGKIAVVPEACPPGYTPLADRRQGQAVAAKYGLGEPYLLAVGTLHTRKNLVRLLEAFALARRQQGLPHRLGLVGRPGWQAFAIEEAITRLGIGDAVVLTGYVPEEDLPLLIGAADALAFPSLYEGFGLPALEAMACRVPVVAANTTSLPEVVGDAGLLVDPCDVEDLACGLARVLTDRALHDELAERGRLRSGLFSWERAASKTLAVLLAAASA